MFPHNFPVNCNGVVVILLLFLSHCARGTLLQMNTHLKEGMDCDGLAGSRQVIDKCGICGGDNSACEIIAGIFRPTVLSVGYHKIIEIPKGAANINITEMVKSRNYIALRNQLGESIINGNWAIDRPGTFSAAGTVFVYKRPNEISSKAGESITAEGPTKEVLHVLIIYQQPNPSVYYEYILPRNDVVNLQPVSQSDIQPFGIEPLNGQLGVYTTHGQRYISPHGNGENLVNGFDAHQFSQEPSASTTLQPFGSEHLEDKKERRNAYNWKFTGNSRCSASCGGGRRYPIFSCVERITHKQVSESLCDMAMRPTPEEEQCNTQPCPAFWDVGEWSECSKTCGPGFQHRQVICRQVYGNQTHAVYAAHCQHLEKPETVSTCQLKICSEWQIRTDWTPCSVPCGVGQRTRDIKCVDNLGDVVHDEECNMKLKPEYSENCDAGPCARSWFMTEWSDRCSAECGNGSQTRSVICLMNHISSLPLEGCGKEKPAESKLCNFGPCYERAEWFTGPWGQCSTECGDGTKSRSVVCLIQSNNSFEVTKPSECSHLEKPPTEQPCHLKNCGAKWFTTEWSACSKSCDGGYRVREVRCLADDMMQSTSCDPFFMPEDREDCNLQQCMEEIDENCRDMYFNCNVVVQARLCIYSYYKTACCASCRKVSRRNGRIRRR
ncbi:thrombospondin type-1 domain-containing protein 4 [Erpetoichthys calabaricus]|uniref:thrombospondin type-1 domain-containing protein 4 n=1 Tax=Erpetoichthys calabaricus TaxID=27687 RepID=UPI0022343FB6|nr:thrombospondin type-1 domain-containing protein 4 [Erpetoichthys calabaricus]